MKKNKSCRNKNIRVNNGNYYVIIGPSTGVYKDVFFDIKTEKETLTFKRKNDEVIYLSLK